LKYSDAINYIEQIQAFGSKPGLCRIKRLLEVLGNPQEHLKIIHVAGTNGKGSTCTMLEAILEKQGYSVGVYTSPHLVKYNERIKINTIPISDLEFSDLTEAVIKQCEQMIKQGFEQPTTFEVITAIAFCYFYAKQVDYLLLEVGLGGRFDATNVIGSPILSIITSIGMDHMDYLGHTLEAIASEKGGIIKKNSPTVLYLQSKEVYNVINDICIDKNSKLYYLTTRQIHIESNNLDKTIFSIHTDYYDYNNITLSMIGDYQLYNASTVLLAVEALRDLDIEISEQAILKGLEQVRWPGRMELISTKPYILLEGAHNFDGIQMLVDYIKNHLSQKNITLLIGVLKDKEYQTMMALLIPVVNQVVVTQPLSHRALDFEQFYNIVNHYGLPTYKEKDVGKALTIAKEITKIDEVIICAGSLYLIGQIKQII
jgi:dihydrofolate synthase/folylpolyglutamate synthase